MKTTGKRISTFIKSHAGPPLLMLGVCILAYGLLIPWLGFYWDDLPMSWIPYELGREKTVLYFSENRPVWGELYWVTTRILPHKPLAWQIFGLFWRWLTGVSFWLLLQKIWPRQKNLALWASLLLLVYPGFNQQFAAYLYAHFWIILTAFLLSYWLMLTAQEKPHLYRPLTLSALLLSAANLWTLEYFFLLDLLRPLALFATLPDGSNRRLRLVRALRAWLPYLGVFVLALYWRLFLYKGQTTHYQFNLLAGLATAPIKTLLDLAYTLAKSVWLVNLPAWLKAFSIPTPSILGWRLFALWSMVTGGLAAGLTVTLLQVRDEPSDGRPSNKEAIAAGLLICLIAGWPFYLIGQPPTLAFPMNRFTIPFMLGTSLLLAGLLEWLPIKPWGKVLLVAFIIAFSAGRQVQWSDEYRRAWSTQKNLFWQMAWRIPDIQPGTMLIMNEDAISYYSDNSLSTPLNWMYAPENRSDELYYMIYFPTNRLGGNNLPALQPGYRTAHNYDRVATFHGNTSQAIVLVYLPPACLRVLEADLDVDNKLIDPLMRQAAALSSSKWILLTGTPRLPEIYSPEPPHGWCYYFQQADLARQRGDWEQVSALGDIAFNLNDHPNDPVERFVFIEGYAHIGNWKRARQISMESYRVSKNYLRPLLCKLWERIDATSPAGPEKDRAVQEMRAELGCTP
ncbi:MAG: hypothetical protein ACUVRJ_01040 [Candidatus Villigracilaceae bacterium]